MKFVEDTIFTVIALNDLEGLRLWRQRFTGDLYQEWKKPISCKAECASDTFIRARPLRFTASRRSLDGTLVKYSFSPEGQKLLGLAVRLERFEILHEMLVMIASSGMAKSKMIKLVNKLDAKANSAAYLASKLVNWQDKECDENKYLHLLVIECGAAFKLQEEAHYLWSNDLMAYILSFFVFVGYIIMIKWVDVVHTFDRAAGVEIDLTCNTLYGISLKPIFITFLDACMMRVLQYFSAHPRYNWVFTVILKALSWPCKRAAETKPPSSKATTNDVDKMEVGAHDVIPEPMPSTDNEESQQQAQPDATTESPAVINPVVALAVDEPSSRSSPGDKLKRGLKSLVVSLSTAVTQASQPVQAHWVDRCLDTRHLLPNHPDKEELAARRLVFEKYVSDASSFDDESRRIGPEMRNHPKFIFIFFQCLKLILSTLISIGKALPGDTTMTSYVNFYGLLVNADLPTVIFSLLSPIHLEVDAVRELEEREGCWGLLVLVWNILVYLVNRMRDLFSFRVFGWYSNLLLFPFIMITPVVFTHFIVAAGIYCWIWLIFLMGGMIAWYYKRFFFRFLHCFDKCFDIWFLLYVTIEILLRFFFVVGCQSLFNVMSIVYLNGGFPMRHNVYLYGLTWTFHLMTSPQCFARESAGMELADVLIFINIF